MSKERIKKLIDKYIKKLRENDVDVEKVILFGSYAKGLDSNDSDLDLCIVSKDFGKDSLLESQFLLKIAAGVDSRIEAIPSGLKDYNTNKISPILDEIKNTGIIIYSKKH